MVDIFQDLLNILQGVTILNKEHILQAFRNEEVSMVHGYEHICAYNAGQYACS